MLAPREVEDAVQEIALRMMRGLPRFRGESSVSTWVYSVARHTCLDMRRRRRATAPLPEDGPPERENGLTPENAFNVSIIACRTALAIDRLPSTQQDVVLLRLGAGLSTEETASRLGITADAVKARLRRARAQLRLHLGETIECPQCGPGSYSVGAASMG